MYRKIINFLIYNKLQVNILKRLNVRQFVVSHLFIPEETDRLAHVYR